MSNPYEAGGEVAPPPMPYPESEPTVAASADVQPAMLTPEDVVALYSRDRRRLARVLSTQRQQFPDCTYEDAVQEAGMRVLRRVQDSERGVEAYGGAAYLATAARNVLTDRARRPENQVQRIDIDDLSSDEPLAVPDASFADVEFADTWRSVRAHLNPDQERVLLLTTVYNYSVPEAAEILNIPLGTAKTRRHYGLQRLRVAIEERRLKLA